MIRTRISLFSIIISILTLFSIIIPILYIADFSGEITSFKTDFFVLTLSFSIAYFLIWPVFIGLIISVVSSLVSSINEEIRYRKDKKKETVATQVDVNKYTTQVKNAFSKVYVLLAESFKKLPHKKEIAIGALAMIAIVVGVSMCGGGSNNSNVEAQLPNWKKFVKVNTGDVNLRKAPDANSPKLMEQQNEMDSELVWSDAPENEYGFPRSPWHLRTDNVCPVISETSEWYEISIPYFTVNAYIMKKFCQEVTPEPVKDTDYQYYNIREIKDGKYSGHYVLSSIDYSSGEADVFLKLGVCQSDAYVFSASLIVSEAERFEKEPYQLYVHPHFGDNRLALPQSCFDGDGVILEKVTDEQLEEWFASMTHTSDNEYYYCFDGQIYKF